MRLLTNELPIFADFYRQLKQADGMYAKQCMEHWRKFITGPPNHPNPDHYGVLELVKHFLRLCEGSAAAGAGAHILGPFAGAGVGEDGGPGAGDY
jgi:hypothetical protein